jgi:hypothetical protein
VHSAKADVPAATKNTIATMLKTFGAIAFQSLR